MNDLSVYVIESDHISDQGALALADSSRHVWCIDIVVVQVTLYFDMRQKCFLLYIFKYEEFELYLNDGYNILTLVASIQQ